MPPPFEAFAILGLNRIRHRNALALYAKYLHFLKVFRKSSVRNLTYRRASLVANNLNLRTLDSATRNHNLSQIRLLPLSFYHIFSKKKPCTYFIQGLKGQNPKVKAKNKETKSQVLYLRENRGQVLNVPAILEPVHAPAPLTITAAAKIQHAAAATQAQKNRSKKI